MHNFGMYSKQQLHLIMHMHWDFYLNELIPTKYCYCFTPSDNVVNFESIYGFL